MEYDIYMYNITYLYIKYDTIRIKQDIYVFNRVCMYGTSGDSVDPCSCSQRGADRAERQSCGSFGCKRSVGAGGLRHRAIQGNTEK